MNDLPPMKSIRVFEACIRLGNFTRAAKELNVGQPAISHQIQSLEQDLGIKLFERRGSIAIPTAEAMNYYRTIASSLADMARASVMIRKRARRRGLTLATYPGIAMFWLLPRLSRIRQLNPELVIRVTTAERDRDIPLDEVDCAILFGDGGWLGYKSHQLFEEVVVPVAAPSVAARFMGASRPDVLTKGPLIHLEDQEQRWFTWSDWRNRRSPETHDIDVGITVTNHGIAIHQALMGHGVALGWKGVIDELVKNKLLLELDSEPVSSERGYYFVTTEDFLDSRVGKLVFQCLSCD